MTVPVKTPTSGDIMESVIAKGDLAKLVPEERVRYYNEVCKSMGLNALTQPFSYITLNGKLTLYATRACADQLRKINGVSLEIVSRDVSDDVLTVHVRARLPDGRIDEDLGAVAFPSTLRGDVRANAELKAITKAKRRATLSICGLGWLDETEIEDIPASAKRPVAKPNAMLPPHDATTGEIVVDENAGKPAPETPQAKGEAVVGEPSGGPRPASDRAGATGSGAALSLEDMAREAAMRGESAFAAFYRSRNKSEKATLNKMGDELRALMNESPK